MAGLLPRNLEDLVEFVALVTEARGDDADLRFGLGCSADLVAEWPDPEKRTVAVRQLLHDRARRAARWMARVGTVAPRPGDQRGRDAIP